MKPNAATLFDEIDRLYPAYLDVLEEVCNIESPTNHKPGVDAVGAYFKRMAKERGWAVEELEQPLAGNPLCITLNPDAKAAPITLSGHIDTVHPVGLFGTPAVRRDEENMYGPGTMDCKGGVVASFLAMDALDRCGFRDRPVQLLIQTDEENGSQTSEKATVAFLCEKAAGSVAFLNTEGQQGDTLVVERKGILRYNFTVHGIARHSAVCTQGASAVREAAYKIIDLEMLKDPDGVTCNCGVIEGGSMANSVPDTCRFEADVRFATEVQAEWVEQKMREVAEKSTVAGCSCEYKQISYRPPMERCERNLKLVDRINEIYAEAGLPPVKARKCLSGSDAAYITQCGIPCIDNIGTEGSFIHSIKEYARLSSLAHSAKQQAAIALLI